MPSSIARIFNYYFFQGVNIVNALCCMSRVFIYLIYDNVKYKSVLLRYNYYKL